MAWLPSYTPTPPPFGPFLSPGADKARLCRRCGSAAGEISACSFKMLRAAQILLREPGGEGGGKLPKSIRSGGEEGNEAWTLWGRRGDLAQGRAWSRCVRCWASCSLFVDKFILKTHQLRALS